MPGGKEIEVMQAHAQWQERRSSRRLFSGQVGAAVRWRPGWTIRSGFGGDFPLFLILVLRDDNGIMASCIDAGEKQA